jgi:hypothetical protein
MRRVLRRYLIAASLLALLFAGSGRVGGGPLDAQAAPPSSAPVSPLASSAPSAPGRAQAFDPALFSDLAIGKGDLRIEQGLDPGFHLYIRKKPRVASILLTETTKDPTMKESNYAYRASEWNPVNGDERRLLDGSFIAGDKRIYSLISSTAAKDPVFGESFHIYIPYVVEWGYPWSRHGKTAMTNGTFINVRSFEKPYADYTGAFRDNPFELRATQRPLKGPPEENYRKDAVDCFKKIVREGELEYAKDQLDLANKIAALLDAAKGKSLDLVICLDTTESMEDDIDGIKRELPALIRKKATQAASIRIGLVLYRDYACSYLTMPYPFSADLGLFDTRITCIAVGQGGDVPEAVHEALWEAVRYPWKAERRQIILIGDAPPHPVDSGVTLSMVQNQADMERVEIDAIILPQ